MRGAFGLALGLLALPAPATPAAPAHDAGPVHIQRDVRIPLRDGIRLAATAYLPATGAPAACVVTLTPYIGVSYHDRGMWFAARGLSFLTIDVRGRGDSEGRFAPNRQEADDGHDVVAWLADQPFCGGKVAMWGGSYAGHAQWATAGRRPKGLATIVPVASPMIGVDFPISRGMIDPYARQWLALVAGRASQAPLAGDSALWIGLARDRFEAGRANAELAGLFGVEEPTMAAWFRNRGNAAWWQAHNPAPADYAGIAQPVLSITGAYDADQAGALAHYRAHMAAATPAARAQHYLVIGPWDHAGTRTPQRRFGGIEAGPASLLDMNWLHLDWYRWTMAGGAKPAFLKDQVAYYVFGAEAWRYAQTLQAVTTGRQDMALGSDRSGKGLLGAGGSRRSDSFLHDPRDVQDAALEAGIDPGDNSDRQLVAARKGRQLVYTSAPFETPLEMAGEARLSAWISLDQPDVALRATLYALFPDGRAVRLGSDRMRARLRDSDFVPRPVPQNRPQLWTFDRFPFHARRLDSGTRLQLVIDPMNSIWVEKAYGSAKSPELETMADARPVTVTLHHDARYPSVLSLPLGR